MTHSQVPDREAVARLAFLDARYKGVQDPHLSIKRFFSCPADSSIGDLVTHSLTDSLTERPFENTTTE